MFYFCYFEKTLKYLINESGFELDITEFKF